MSLLNYLKGVFGSEKSNPLDEGYESHLGKLKTTIAYKTLAIETCASLISNSIALAEFETYEGNKKVRKNNYYAFNVQPNKNQNASEFWKEAVFKLLTKNECLIVQMDGDFLVADSFTHEEKALQEDIYINVVVRGYKLYDIFRESEVIYLKLNNKDIKRVIDSVYADYEGLIASAKKSYKKANGKNVIVKLDSLTTINDREQQARKDLFEKQFKNWFDSEYSVLPIGKGMEYYEPSKNVTTKDSRDIRNLIEDIFIFTCSAYHVPHLLAMGSVAGLNDLIDSFLMFGIKPVVDLIGSELNRKVYEKEDYLNGYFIKINTKKIKLVDIQKLATTTDIFLRSGVHSINDNKELLDEVPINEDWANQYYMTKNYQTILNKESEGVKNE